MKAAKTSVALGGFQLFDDHFHRNFMLAKRNLIELAIKKIKVLEREKCSPLEEEEER